MMMFIGLMITALVGSASASFSIGCITTLMGISADPGVAACLNPSMLLPVLLSAGNDSLIKPIDSWLTGVCASQACSSDTISAVVNNLTAGCQAEFKLPPQSQASQTVAAVQQYYATARKVSCLASGNQLCVTSELGLLQTSVGTINLDQSNVNSILLLGQFGFTPNITCTDCMHGAVTIINQDLPGVISQDSMNRASNACGASFSDGGIPPGLVQTAVGLNNNTTAPSSTTTSTTSSTTSPSSTPYVPAPAPSKKSSALGRSSISLSLIFTSILFCALLLV